MKIKWQWIRPKCLLLWCLFQLIRVCVICFPYRWQMHFGAWLGRLSYPFLKRRKNIAMINLKIAFPDKDADEIEKLCKKCFESIAISGIEMMIAWFMPKKRFNRIQIDFHGAVSFDKAHNDGQQGVLLLGAHFTCMEIIGRYMGERYDNFYLVYQKHSNDCFEKLMTDKRESYVSGCLQRKNVVSIVKALKRSASVWYAPDQDFGQKRSIFVPFFGKECATLVATSWLAAKTSAKVLPCYYTRKPNFKGYDFYILPALDDFPSGDDYEDAVRYHQILEQAITQHPEQYLWQHRRYKTRPEGEKAIY